MMFSGSFVTYGHGRVVVTDIGMQTEVGKIAGLLKTTSEKQTPLQVSLEEFGKKLSILILVFCGILFAVNVFRGEKIQQCIYVCGSPCGRSDSRGIKLDRYYCSFLWDTEDGKGACDHPETSGCGRSWKCFGYLLG